jgi:hypothetical protein
MTQLLDDQLALTKVICCYQRHNITGNPFQKIKSIVIGAGAKLASTQPTPTASLAGQCPTACWPAKRFDEGQMMS